MTRRERLEAKLAKRKQWAEKAEARAEQRSATVHSILEPIPLGQPVLVGHHSEKRHRRALDRADANMRKAAEESALAHHHTQKADGLARQLDRSIFSDDPDAVEQLRAKVAALTVQRDAFKNLNAWWRKRGTMRGCPGVSDEQAAKLDAEIPTRYSWERQPVPKWRIANLGAEIRRAAERITDVERRQARTAGAESSGGVLIEGTGDYVRVTFAEKPARDVLDALKAAGFRWGAGSWVGRRDAIPAGVQAGLL
jgi:hypothetical protein